MKAELEGMGSDIEEPKSSTKSTSPVKSTTVVVQSSTGTLATLSTLQSRLDMYHQAHDGAKASNDSSKARRLDRGIKVNLFLLFSLICIRNEIIGFPIKIMA